MCGWSEAAGYAGLAFLRRQPYPARPMEPATRSAIVEGSGTATLSKPDPAR